MKKIIILVMLIPAPAYAEFDVDRYFEQQRTRQEQDREQDLERRRDIEQQEQTRSMQEQLNEERRDKRQ